MRIVSDKVDYYDCIQKHGVDRSNVYVRKPKRYSYRFESPEARELMSQLGNCIGDSTAFHGNYVHNRVVPYLSVVGFCGKLYPAVRMSVRFYTLNSYDNWEDAARTVLEYLPEFLSRSSMSIFERWMSLRDKESPILKEVPVWALHGDNEGPDTGHRYCISVTENSDTLGTMYEFYTVKDPYTAYQELSMFLVNLAQPEKEMPVISDELKAQSKGFNEWSFRKPPSKKSRKRKSVK